MTGRRRAVFAVVALAAWVAGSALGSIGAVAPASAQSAGIVIGKAHAGYAPSLTGNKPIVLLVVGSGARMGDDIQHSLADSIHVVSINPDKHKATIIGIPRDSWVDIPGHGTNKINASMVEGGPDLLIQTVESISGLKIDYYALTTFWGLTQLYDNLGGLTIDVPFPMQDSYSGADFEPGVQTHGRQAGARVLPGPAQRDQRGLRAFGERRPRVDRVAHAVPQGVPVGPELAVHVDRVGHAQRGHLRSVRRGGRSSRTPAPTSTRKA